MPDKCRARNDLPTAFSLFHIVDFGIFRRFSSLPAGDPDQCKRRSGRCPTAFCPPIEKQRIARSSSSGGSLRESEGHGDRQIPGKPPGSYYLELLPCKGGGGIVDDAGGLNGQQARFRAAAPGTVDDELKGEGGAGDIRALVDFGLVDFVISDS